MKEKLNNMIKTAEAVAEFYGIYPEDDFEKLYGLMVDCINAPYDEQKELEKQFMEELVDCIYWSKNG